MAIRPFILTIGEPAGIGPELTVKLCQMQTSPRPWLAMGHKASVQAIAQTLGHRLDVTPVASPLDFHEWTPGKLYLHDVAPDITRALPLSKASPEGGMIVYRAIQTACEWIQTGSFSGLVTGPINKESLAQADIPYPGHTEMLADLTGSKDVAMMLANDELAVVLVSIHVSLKHAIDGLSEALVLKAIRLANQGMKAAGIRQPRVAVAGLNPHAGEGGLFGNEEALFIQPAIARAQSLGIHASGPWPPDSVFMRARHRRDFDIVVAQYHDQGLIPIKYLGIDQGVNITLGLPFVRTSVDHGTAFDIAGKGVADVRSLQCAMEWAHRLDVNRHHALFQS